MTIPATITLNARVRPADRGDRYEDALFEALDGRAYFEIVGGGSLLSSPGGEIEYCCIDVDLFKLDRAIPLITKTLTDAGAPQGSHLSYNDASEKTHVTGFGGTVGLAIYLNGTDLPKKVYARYGIDDVITMVNELLKGFGSYQSYWQGPTETALYIYGSSHQEMRDALRGFLADYPLCQKARLVDLPTKIDVAQ